MVALRTWVCTAASNLNGLSSKAPMGLPALSPAKKTDQGRGIKVCFLPFLGHYLLCEISTSLAAAGFFSPQIDRSHYKINVTKIAHNASEKCNTISGSLSSF